MLPSDLLAFQFYPTVHEFIVSRVDVLVADVKAMMRLPLPEVGIEGRCAFAAATTLCSIIGGVSMVLYKPGVSGRSPAWRFLGLLKEFYPWQGERYSSWQYAVQDRETRAKVLYELVRNPVAHSFGVLGNNPLRVDIAKERLSEQQIDGLEKSDVLPYFRAPAVTAHHLTAPGESHPGYVITVGGLYWGVFHLLWNLAKNESQMREAEAHLATDPNA